VHLGGQMFHLVLARARGIARACRSYHPGTALALVLALVATAALTSTSPAQQEATGRITGVVTDSTTGQPLSAVSVAVEGTRLGGLTNAEGRYTIERVPVGTHTLQTRRIGYSPRNIPGVSVTAGETATANIALMASALTLEAVVTTGVVD